MKPSTKENPAQEHLLLTVLGKNPKPARYTLKDREAEARLAPVALFELSLTIGSACTPQKRRSARSSHSRSKTRNQRWIDFLRSTVVLSEDVFE